MSDFKPSNKSLDPSQYIALRHLDVIQRFAKALETECKTGGLPDWVNARVEEAAMSLGVATTFMRKK